MNKANNSIRWMYLVIGALALLFAGIIYAWSILKAPLADEFGWTASALSLNFTITMCCFCVGGIVGGTLMKKLGFRIDCIIGAVLSALGFVGASVAGGKIGILYVSYGVLSGFGIGMAYNAIISTVNAWFPDKKGLCSGVLMMGFGASALILGSIADALIGNAAVGWRNTYRILGILLGLVLLVAAFVIKRPAVAAPGERTDSPASTNDYTVAQMLCSIKFWKAFVCVVFLAAVGNTVISMAKDLAVSVGVGLSAATTLVGVLSVCNGLGRIITGAVFDRFGRRITMIGANIGAICAAGITLLAVISGSALLCVVGLCLTGLSYGTCPTISSAYISEVFGSKYFSTNFSVMNCNLLVASFIATGASLITSATGTYAGAFILLLSLTLIAMVLNLSLEK